METVKLVSRFIVGALVPLLVGCSLESDRYDTPIAERLVDARDRFEDPDSSYRTISTDRIASAREAAASGDHRFISFVDAYLGSDMIPYFPGVSCSIPKSLSPIVQRTQWVHYVSDVLNEEVPPQPNVAVAVQYNRAILNQPTFPYGDLCKGIQAVNGRADLSDSGTPQVSLFARVSANPALLSSPDDQIAVLIRNDPEAAQVSAEDLEKIDSFGLTPLSWAALRGAKDLVTELLERGADPWAGVRCFNPSAYPTQPVYIPDLPGYDDRRLSPIGLAASAGHAEIIELMLDAAAQKECGDSPLGGTPADSELQVILDMIGRFSGLEEQQRRMFRYALLEAQDPVNEYRKHDPYRELVKIAEGFDFRSELRTISKPEAASNRETLLKMAATSSLDDLEYWFDRLSVESNQEIAEMIDDAARHHFWCEGKGCENDASTIFNWLLDRIGAPSEKQNAVVIEELFRGNLGPLDSRESILRDLVGTLVNRGYNFDFENGKDCTLVMQSLSYLRDECETSDVSPEFAEVLIELGVNVRRPRTPNGLTALDLAQRRSERGPYPEAFQAIARRLSELDVNASER